MTDTIKLGGNSARNEIWEESKIDFVLMSEEYSETMVSKLDISCSFYKVHWAPQPNILGVITIKCKVIHKL